MRDERTIKLLYFLGGISMFGWLFSIFSWLTELWGKVPDPVKEKIINMIVETFEAMFREFFRSKKKEQEAKNEQF
ncbi:hypothetical protein FHG08_18060 [Pseudoalteromonas sp. Scap03]|uniref:hypothetical protein n=1 Tax=unclassified Pseudoalteromonas TaxID=194690 RepID=UPI0015BD9802|nr:MULTISPECIES: hypothetical protein [unclassified Pseudoalteromonas]NWL17556.1 hypothetical protein [Pseudoalteromonas sp. Scap03]QLE82982.1 hypothetical protein FLM54_15685 [Pseudoalteromonas sp. Scap25]QLE90924.1 hypothetical protein FLM47_15695 [Pseudoalteromonas sp. Scap06]